MIIKDVDKILRAQITQSDLLSILFKEYSAIMAGGTAYAVAKGYTIEKHLRNHPTADIDLYFPDEKSYIAAVNYLSSIQTSGNKSPILLEKSVSGMCYNVYPQNRNFSDVLNESKIQLVGCFFGSPNEIITSFDFKNLEVCYFLKSGRYFQGYTENFSNLDELIDIRHNRSPFLMHRIYKYITYRGFTGVTEQSKEIVTDWIVKASTGYYEQNRDGCPTIYIDLLNNESFKGLLRNKKIVTDEDLSFLIGRVKEDVYESIETYNSRGYRNWHPTKVGQRDVVVEEIKNRR